MVSYLLVPATRQTFNYMPNIHTHTHTHTHTNTHTHTSYTHTHTSTHTHHIHTQAHTHAHTHTQTHTHTHHTADLCEYHCWFKKHNVIIVVLPNSSMQPLIHRSKILTVRHTCRGVVTSIVGMTTPFLSSYPFPCTVHTHSFASRHTDSHVTDITTNMPTG